MFCNPRDSPVNSALPSRVLSWVVYRSNSNMDTNVSDEKILPLTLGNRVNLAVRALEISCDGAAYPHIFAFHRCQQQGLRACVCVCIAKRKQRLCEVAELSLSRPLLSVSLTHTNLHTDLHTCVPF